MDWLWRQIESHVEAAITRRIVAFHSALIERGQITPPNAPQYGVTVDCTEDRAICEDQFQQPPVEFFRR